MRRKRWVTLVGMIAVMAMVAAACGDDDDVVSTPAPTPAPTSAPTPAPTAAPCVWEIGDAWDACAPDEWQGILDAAADEGAVVVGGFGFLADAMAAGFKEDTGLDLDWLGGGGGEVSARLEQEVRAGNLTIDLILGGGTEVRTLHPDGLLANVGAQLILPSVQDGPQWRDGTRQWYDDDASFLLEGAGWVFDYIVVNADEVDPASITVWADLLKPEFVGKIIAYDPVVQGPGQGGAVAMAASESGGPGIDYLVSLFAGDQEVTFVQDNTQVVEAVARGTQPIGMFALQSQIENFKEEGFNLEVVRPADWPGYLTSGFSVIKGGIDPPHPNAAQVFLNWYASTQGQTIYQGFMRASSNRTDVDKSGLPAYVVPQDGVTYWEDSYEEFRLNERTVIVDLILESLGGR